MQTEFLSSLREWGERLGQLWAPLLIVVGVLTLSVGLPLATSPRSVLLLLGLLLGVATLLAFLRWPPMGLVALVLVGLLVPSPSLPGGLNVAVLLLGLLIALWLLKMVSSRRLRLTSSKTLPPLLAFMAVTILAFSIGQLSWFSYVPKAPLDAQIGGLFIFILAGGVFLLVAHQIQDVRWLQLLVWPLLILGVLPVVGWAISWQVGNFSNRFFQRGTLNNSMFWLWLVAFSLSQALYNRKLHRLWRLALGVLFVATMYVLFVKLSDWKSGYLPAFVAVAVIVGARSWRVALLLMVLVIIPLQLLTNQAIATDEYSYSTRLDAWIIVLQMVKANPVLGFGPANYYWYTPLFPIRGFAVQFNSHNQFVDIIAQIGFLGLGCFLWFVWEVGWLAWQLRNRAPVGFAQAYVYGALGGLAGMLVSGMFVDWFLPFVYNIGLTGFRAGMLAWIFLGGVVTIEQVVRRQAETLPS